MTVEEQERDCGELEELLLEMESRFQRAEVQVERNPSPKRESELLRIRSELDAGWAEYHELNGYPRPMEEAEEELRGLISDLQRDLDALIPESAIQSRAAS